MESVDLLLLKIHNYKVTNSKLQQVSGGKEKMFIFQLSINSAEATCALPGMP